MYIYFINVYNFFVGEGSSCSDGGNTKNTLSYPALGEFNAVVSMCVCVSVGI